MARKLVLVTLLKVVNQGHGGKQGLLVNITKKISWPWKQRKSGSLSRMSSRIGQQKKNEWHIGLSWDRTVSNWTWVNGKPLTIMKWKDSEPSRNSYYALIAKEWPTGSYGKFDRIRGNIKRAWICEEETGVNIIFIFYF